MSGAGDVNGDGVDDLLIGVRHADPNGSWGAGESYVVFGRAEVDRLPIADGFLRRWAPNTNEGANPRLRIRPVGGNRVVVGFDLAGIDPERVISATLVLHIAEIDLPGGRQGWTVYAHPCGRTS